MFHAGPPGASSSNAGLQERSPDGFAINTKSITDLNQGLTSQVALDHLAQLAIADLRLSTRDPGSA
jgi:hypothetical protein